VAAPREGRRAAPPTGRRRLPVALVALAALAACGKRGDPLPPLRHIPQPVADLQLSQRGDRLEIRYVAPRITTSGERLPLLEIELLRADAGADFDRLARSSRRKAAPGEALVESEPLPPEGTTVYVAARALAKGEASTRTSIVSLTVQPRSDPPTEVRASLLPQGVRVRWTPPEHIPELIRPSPSPTPSPSPGLLPSPGPGASPESTPPGSSPSPGPGASPESTPPGLSPSPGPGASPASSPPPSPRSGRGAGTPSPAAEPTPAPSPEPSPVPGSVGAAAEAGAGGAAAGVPGTGPSPAASPSPSPSPTPEPGGFWVYRRESEGPYAAPLSPQPLAESPYLDLAAALGIRYCYSVRTVLSTAPIVESAPSEEACVAVRDIAPPPTPAGVAALVEEGVVEVSWSRPRSEDVAGYRLYRAVRGESPELLADLPPGTTAFRDATVAGGTVYVYTLSAVDAAGNESPPSAASEVRVP
jgi:predicted small lipoprotein YifL